MTTATASDIVDPMSQAPGIDKGRDRLRILLVSEDTPSPQLGGLGKHVITLARALMREGHRVSLLGRTEPDYASCSQEMGYSGDFIPGLPDVAGWAEMRLGFFNPWKRSYFARRYAEVIARVGRDFDVVHYHGHLPLIAHFLPQSLPFVQTRHDQGSECIIHLRYRDGDICQETDPRACAACAHPRPAGWQTALSAQAVVRYRAQTESAFRRHPVVFVSEFLRRNYQRAVPQADVSRSHVIHNFVQEARLFQAGHGLHKGFLGDTSQRELVIHVAGRLDAAKGIVDFVDLIAPHLPPTWLLRVLGHGPQRADLEARHGQSSQVAIMGHRGYDDTMASARQSDVIIVPSIWEEACATVVLEALRLGKPCLALNRGSTPELAPYGATGQLRLFDTLPDLVQALLQSTPQQWREMQPGGESADVSRQLPALLALYRQVAVAAAACAPTP